MISCIPLECNFTYKYMAQNMELHFKHEQQPSRWIVWGWGDGGSCPWAGARAAGGCGGQRPGTKYSTERIHAFPYWGTAGSSVFHKHAKRRNAKQDMNTRRPPNTSSWRMCQQMLRQKTDPASLYAFGKQETGACVMLANTVLTWRVHMD